MEEQWDWLTNYKDVYTRPSILQLYRQREVIDQSCETSWHIRVRNIYCIWWFVRGQPFVILLLSYCLSGNPCVEKSIQLRMLKLINGNCYIKACDEIRDFWTNLKPFHHTLAVWKNSMHFFLMATFFFLDLVFPTTSSLHTCIKNDSESEERKKVSRLHMPFVLIFCYPKQLN